MSRRRAGFTLIEVAVGLASAAMILLLARGVLDGIGDSGRRVASAARSRDASGTVELTLREVVATSGAVAWDSGGVTGDAGRAHVRSRCLTPSGWHEPCVVRIEVSADSVLVLGPRQIDHLVVASGFVHASLLYLRSAKSGGQWLQSWPAAHVVPLAIGLVVDGDTLILPTAVLR